MIDCLTDNRIRTVAEVRHALAKNGGNLGTEGSVNFLFKHCGQFIFAPGASEEKIMTLRSRPAPTMSRATKTARSR